MSDDSFSFTFEGMGLEPDDQAWLQSWFATPGNRLALSLECEVFIAKHFADFTVFADLVLEDYPRARHVVTVVLTRIAADWENFTRGPNPPAHGLEKLVEEVVIQAHQMGRARALDDLAEKARDLLRGLRRALDEPEAETEVGLYRALRQLQTRQFDVLILKAGGHSSVFIAWLLQTHPATVDRNFNKAKAYVGGELQLRHLLKKAPQPSPSARTRRTTGATP